MTDQPIVCTLQPDALAARREALLETLFDRVEERQDRSGGYAFRFAPAGDTLTAIARAVEAERHCCRFMRFQITAEPSQGPIWLEITGPPGTREFLTALLDRDEIGSR